MLQMPLEDKLKAGVKASRNATLALALLALLKGVVGFYSGSSALFADAIHTGLDIFTSLAVWIGLKVSLKSSGEKFPYGYYKAENLVALFVSFLILFSGFEVLKMGFIGLRGGAKSEIFAPKGFEFEGLALATALFSVFSIYALALYKKKVGRAINSQALLADARHSYTDVFSSLVVVVAVLGSWLGISELDFLGVIVISALIFKLGVESTKDAVLTLMDAWLDEAATGKIRKNIMDIPGVLELEALKLRKSGLVVFGEVVLEIEEDAALKKVEFLNPKIKSAVEKEVGNLEHLIITAKPAKKQTLKIAIPVLENKGLETRFSGHLGKAPYFFFASLEAGSLQKWTILKNPSNELERKRGIKAVDFLLREGAEALIVCEVGEGPFHMLRDSFVRIYRVSEGASTVGEILKKCSDLKEITSPTE
ncbi:MAG: cation diffusion facilitator family transporter [Methanosarcinaceae archaeon]|nr:cation diffusion facilitator family transporter [Methanosarcinaceae archaeon]